MSDPAAAAPFTDPSPALRLLVAARVGREPSTGAVVGNAPLPPSAERARAIDACDVVVRMTTFDVDREEDRVGRRTDVVVLHRAVHAGPATFRDHRSRVYVLAEPGRSYWEQEPLPAWWPVDLGVVPIPNRTVVDPLKRRMRIADGTASWPTTGTLAVHLLHALFPAMDVLLTGTTLGGALPADRSRFAHSWGDAVLLTPEHRLRAERRVVRDWQREGFLRVLP